MTYLRTAEYIAAYATARSSLAALADLTVGEGSRRFERELVSLDKIHHGVVPAIYPLIGSRRDLRVWLEVAVEHMIAFGGDPLRLELVLASSLAI